MPRHANYLPNGVIPAILLPFNDDLSIDERSFRAHIRDVGATEGLSALTINDNVVFVSILPADRAGGRAFVSVAPFADYYHVDNRIITTPAGTARRIFFNREPGSTALTLWGEMPLDDQGANEALAIEDPAAFASELFRRLLEKRGITIYGADRAHHTLLAADIKRFLERPNDGTRPIQAPAPDAPPGPPIGDAGMDWLARPPM